MNRETEEKLAGSLTAETTELLPFLPYLLQDLYNDFNNRMIAARANELIRLHPERRTIFEGYINSQLNECDDLENQIVGVTWMLRKA